MIASPSSIVGLNPEHLKRVKAYLIRNKQEYAKIVAEIVYENRVIETSKTRNIMLCRDSILDLVNALKAILDRDSLSY
jgi:tartrate dehydratase alpha subunit/fumarate hydratase class I-like protein